MGNRILVVGTYDTKDDELGYLAGVIRAQGGEVISMDVSVLGDPSKPTDFSKHDVAAEAGSSIAEAIAAEDENVAMQIMATGASRLAARLHREGRFDGVLALGGTMGTDLALDLCAALRAMKIEAWPVLVNSLTRGTITRRLPSPFVYAHMLTGDFATAEMEKLLTEKFGVWTDKKAPAINLSAPTAFTGKKLLLVDKPDSTQTYFEIGNIGVARTNADRVYINVINTLFGGRFTSMLNDALRVSSGLTYGARSGFSQRKAAGPFAISTYTRNETTEKAIDLALEILKRLHEKGVSEADLKSAKNYIKGQYPPRIETSDQQAALIAELEFYGLDERDINEYYSRIDAMTQADAERVIKQYFPLDNLVFVLIGKASEIETVARKYAPKFETKSINQPGF